ncbi:8753_t:CDS:2 [Funneliformis geosporum]|nr:8753_t:CDS:2 [Funneliformis geosporum]
MEYTKYKKNRLECLDLSFQYEGKDRLVSTNAKIDMKKQGLTIYGDFVPFCEETDSSESKETNGSKYASLKQ